MMTCRLCGAKTTGAISAAGLRWPGLCQPCKDLEDRAAEIAVSALATAVDSVYEAFPETTGDCDETTLEER